MVRDNSGSTDSLILFNRARASARAGFTSIVNVKGGSVSSPSLSVAVHV